MKLLLLVIACALVLGGMFLMIRPDGPAPRVGPDAEPSAAAPPVVHELVVEKGALVSGPGVIRVRQGDPVRIRVTSDVADEFHLHGYDEKLQLRAGEPATLELDAHLSGRFGYELHGTHVELGALEVLPD